MKKIILLAGVLLSAAFFYGCGGTAGSNTEKALQNPGDTPTAAYKRLFSAVKSKNTVAIKAELSDKTIPFAESLAARQKKSVDEVFANGFTATTFSETLPEIRDERVKDRMGAIEVWNSKDSKWEDLPFVREETGWKLAIGDVFANTYRSPGKGLDMIEKEAANAAAGNRLPGPKGDNFNANTKFKPLSPANSVPKK